MLEYCKGNIFDSDADAIVVPVNCDGILNKWFVARFRERCPKLLRKCRKDCRENYIRPGVCTPYLVEELGRQCYVFCLGAREHETEGYSRRNLVLAMAPLIYHSLALRLNSVAIDLVDFGIVRDDWLDALAIVRGAADRMPEVRVSVYVDP